MSRCKAPEILRSEAYMDIRCNDEGRGERRNWAFFSSLLKLVDRPVEYRLDVEEFSNHPDPEEDHIQGQSRKQNIVLVLLKEFHKSLTSTLCYSVYNSMNSFVSSLLDYRDITILKVNRGNDQTVWQTIACPHDLLGIHQFPFRLRNRTLQFFCSLNPFLYNHLNII